MCNICPYEIAAYDMDLAYFSFLHSVVPGSFLTPQSPFLIAVRFSMADLARANSYRLLHLHA
jgi:hypothetical protein